MAIRVSPTRPIVVTASTIKKAKEDEARKIQDLLGLGASAARSIEQGVGSYLMANRRGFRPDSVHMKGGMVEAMKNLSLDEAKGLQQHLDSGNWSRTSTRTDTYLDFRSPGDPVTPSPGAGQYQQDLFERLMGKSSGTQPSGAQPSGAQASVALPSGAPQASGARSSVSARDNFERNQSAQYSSPGQSQQDLFGRLLGTQAPAAQSSSVSRPPTSARDNFERLPNDRSSDVSRPPTAARDTFERLQSARAFDAGRGRGQEPMTVERTRDVTVTNVEPYIKEHADGAYTDILGAQIATLEAEQDRSAAELQARSLEARALRQAARGRFRGGLFGNASAISWMRQLNSAGGSRGAAGRTAQTSSLGGFLGTEALNKKKKAGVNTPG